MNPVARDASAAASARKVEAKHCGTRSEWTPPVWLHDGELRCRRQRLTVFKPNAAMPPTRRQVFAPMPAESG